MRKVKSVSVGSRGRRGLRLSRIRSSSAPIPNGSEHSKEASELAYMFMGAERDAFGILLPGSIR